MPTENDENDENDDLGCVRGVNSRAAMRRFTGEAVIALPDPPDDQSGTKDFRLKKIAPTAPAELAVNPVVLSLSQAPETPDLEGLKAKIEILVTAFLTSLALLVLDDSKAALLVRAKLNSLKTREQRIQAFLDLYSFAPCAYVVNRRSISALWQTEELAKRAMAPFYSGDPVEFLMTLIALQDLRDRKNAAMEPATQSSFSGKLKRVPSKFDLKRPEGQNVLALEVKVEEIGNNFQITVSW